MKHLSRDEADRRQIAELPETLKAATVMFRPGALPITSIRQSNMTRVFKGWFLSLVWTTAFVTVSFQWLDRPIALWVYHLFGGRRIPTQIVDRIASTPVVTATVFVTCGIIAIMGRRLSKVEIAVAMCAISSLAAIVIKDLLKFVFGRTWPDTWGPGIVSFVRDNVYGFNFFQSGRAFEVVSIWPRSGCCRRAFGRMDIISGAESHLRDRHLRCRYRANRS